MALQWIPAMLIKTETLARILEPLLFLTDNFREPPKATEGIGNLAAEVDQHVAVVAKLIRCAQGNGLLGITQTGVGEETVRAKAPQQLVQHLALGFIAAVDKYLVSPLPGLFHQAAAIQQGFGSPAVLKDVEIDLGHRAFSPPC
jgi:hypothetical protein